MVDDVRRAGVINQVGLVLRDSPAFLLPAAPDRPARERPGHERRVPRRPVHPDPGPVRLDVAGRPDQGRLGHAARALDPRPRHPRVAARPGHRRQRPVERVPRHRRHRGRRGGHPRSSSRARSARSPRSGTTCSSDRACAGSRSSASRATSGSRTTCGARCTGPGPAATRARSAAPTWSAALAEAGIAVRNPDQAFIEAVQAGEPADPGLRRRPAGPPAGRRHLPLGGRSAARRSPSPPASRRARAESRLLLAQAFCLRLTWVAPVESVSVAVSPARV